MKSSDEYVVWKSEPVPHAFVLHKLQGVDLHFQLVKGVPRLEGFPEDAVHTVDPDYPNDITPMDSFRSPHLITLISSRLKDFIASMDPKDVEFLPVGIHNHKDKSIGQYFILHPTHPVDCLDKKLSEAKPHVAVPKSIGEIKRIVLDDAKVDFERDLFKIRGLFREILIRKRVADGITEAGFTGVGWTALPDYSHN